MCESHTTNQTRVIGSNPLRADPTRTSQLRLRFEQLLRGKFNRLKGDIRRLLVDEDAFGIKRKRSLNESTDNQRFEFQTSSEQVTSFEGWLKEQVDDGVLDGKTSADKADGYWRAFSDDAYRRGAGRAFTDVRKPALSTGEDVSDFFEGTRDEFLRQSFARPVAIDKLKVLAGRVFTDLKNVTEAMSTQLSRQLTDGLARGESPSVIAKELAETVDKIGARRATMIARTEVIRAHAESQLDAMENLGVTEVGVMVEWSTAGDDRVCPLCQPLEGVVMTIQEARGLIPRHPQCVTGDSLIVADDVKALLKTHYTGEIIELVTANGRRLSVTANHILLTKFGFIPARFAYEGLEIVASIDADIDSVATPDDDRRKSCIADIFASFAEDPLMLSERMELAPEDLHGDGKSCDSEVHIVGPDSELWNETWKFLLPDTVQAKFQSFQFVGPESSLSSVSPAAQVLYWTARAFDGSMGRFRELLALILGCILHAKEHGITAASLSYTSILEAFRNNTPRAAELLRECLDAHPILKKLDNLSIGEIEAIALGLAKPDLTCDQVDPCISEPPGDASIADSISPCDGDGVLSSMVSLDQIASVNVVHVSNLPVYDVQTLSTVYRVNGIITSNCRCSYTPANVGEPKNDKSTVHFTNPDTGKVERKVIPQKRTPTQIKQAQRQSIKAEIPKSSKRTIAQQKQVSTWKGADARIRKKRPRAVVEAGPEQKPTVRPGRLPPKQATVSSLSSDFKKLDKNFDTLPPTNLLGEPGFNRFIVGSEIVRDGQKVSQRLVVFDAIADEKGKGAFTKSINKLKKANVPIRMDNVQTERFKEGLERLGFKRHGKTGMIWDPKGAVVKPRVITPKPSVTAKPTRAKPKTVTAKPGKKPPSKVTKKAAKRPIQPVSAQRAKEATQDYTTDAFQRVNTGLREGKVVDKRIVDGTDSYLKSSPKSAGSTVRSFSATQKQKEEILAELKTGTFTDKAFVSTRKNPTLTDRISLETGNAPSGRVVLRVKGKGGVDISDISLNPGEGEVLYPRNTKFRVTGVTETPDGGIIADIEEITQ